MGGKDNGGWIRHRGGKCPVEAGTLVDVKLRCRHEEGGVQADDVLWVHDGWGHPDEVMQWRLHNPEQATTEQSSDVEMPAAKYFDGPLQWRDRILELDAEQKAADEAHKDATEARDAERASLVAKLKAEGLALVQAEDMSDPANWQVDDLVEITGSTNDGWLRFKGMKGHLKYDGDWFVNFGLANEWYLSDNTDIKWHSRPAK